MADAEHSEARFENPADPVRVGVIGLGPRWRQRYRPALLALPRQFRVTAVCDQIAFLTLAEARRLDCTAAPGPTDLLERDEVEAVLLLDPQWFRLWPLEAACRLGKPVFCCGSFDNDDEHADALYGQLRERRLPVLLEMLPRGLPVLGRLRELLAERLGPARLVLAEAAQGPVPLASTAGLLACASDLLAGAPVKFHPTVSVPGGLTTLALEFDQERFVQITTYRAPGPPGVRLQVVAERGTATVKLPNRLAWRDDTGRHAHTLPADRPLAHVLLDQFYQVVRAGREPDPGPELAYRLLGWMRAARDQAPCPVAGAD